MRIILLKLRLPRFQLSGSAMSFLDTFTGNVRRNPNKVALEFIDPPRQSVTYAELDQLVEQTASYLQSLGLQPGDRVALQLSKGLEFILLHLATVRLGAITLPLNLGYPPDEIEYFLSDSGARLFFALEANAERLQPVLRNLPELQEAIFLNPAEPDPFQSLITNSHSSGLDTGFARNAQPYSTSEETQSLSSNDQPTGGLDLPFDEHSGLLDHSSNNGTAIIIYT